MVLNWRAAPFVRLVPPLALGIGLATFYSYSIPTLFIALLLLGLLLLQLRKPLPHQQWYFGILLSCFLFCLGYALHQGQIARHYPSSLQEWEKQRLTAVGKVLKTERGRKYTRIGLQLQQALAEDGVGHQLDGRILLYLPDTTTSFKLGDKIEFQGQIQPIPGPGNPKAFDFAAFMRSQGYYIQSFVKEGQWRHSPNPKAAWIQRHTLELKRYCLSILRKHLPTTETYAIGAALITGHRSALSPSIRDSYAKTGAMHVLAVSGLHVGLIYLGLQHLFGLFGSWYGRWKWIRVGGLLLGIWSFVYFTGATASVVRAGCMFSFIIVGQSLKRYTNIYNTIAASAFCMLLVNPQLLLNIGFQLSYLALLGIVFFQPFIYRVLYCPNRLLDYCWKLSSVALAAQLTTLPISLFYFHQFPVYFLLSGLVVVPAAMLILGLGLGLFMVDLVPFLGQLLGHLLQLTIKGMNAVIFFLEGLPFSTIQDVWISKGILLSLFATIFLIGIYFLRPKTQISFALALLLIALAGQISWQSWNRYQQRELVIYQVKGQTVVDCISGRRCLRIIGKMDDSASRAWATNNYQSYRGVQEMEVVNWRDTVVGEEWFYQNGLLQFRDFKMAILNRLPIVTGHSLASFDLVLLHNDPTFALTDLRNMIKTDQLVWDGSNSYWQRKKWAANCEQQGIDAYDVHNEGALVIRL